MLRFNKKVEYGVLALQHLGISAGSVSSVREIADSYRIPETLLSKIMQKMKQCGLVKSVHGNQGGYRLERNLKEINLLELTEILTGPVELVECFKTTGVTVCPVQEKCTLVSPMQVLNKKVNDLFSLTTIASLTSERNVQ